MNTSATSTAELNAPGPFQADSKQLDSLHLAKTPPGPNDWLATQYELGQTFGQYFHSFPSKLSEEQKYLYILPLGEFSSKQNELISQTSELLSCFYNLPTKLLEPDLLETVPSRARRESIRGPQLLTTYVLHEVLKPARSKDAIAVLGLTAVDLWPGEGWNFTFGQASQVDRVGVWSLSRFGDPDGAREEWQAYRKRTFKVALHETGHMLSMPHCIHYECLMNGTNHLAEMDSLPLWACPECVRKVWWHCKADPAARYRLLIDFARQNDLPQEQEFWQRSLELLQ